MPCHDLQISHIRSLKLAYQQLLGRHNYDAILITSGSGPQRFADDQSYHHHGYGHFLHWTGLTGVERSWLRVEADGSACLWLHTPEDFWHAVTPLPDELWTDEIEAIGRAEAVPPVEAFAGRVALLGDPASFAGLSGAAALDINPPGFLADLDRLRVLKSDYEIASLERATELAALGHRAARAAFEQGESEFGISLAYQRATGQREAHSPYHSIIGLNEHAAVLHYQHYETAPPTVSRSLLIDAGVRYRGYGSDITRTHAAPDGGHFGALIKGVESLQRRLCKEVRPGLDFVELHQLAHQGLAILLKATGLVDGLSEEAIVESGISRAFFPHGLGHLLGIQVHDVAGKPRPAPDDCPFLRLTHCLEERMVLTIEPGLYFIPALLEPLMAGKVAAHLNRPLINDLYGCGGIRIEDNVLVTVDGHRNLTREYLLD